MPNLSGFELAEQVRDKVKNLVLVTGHPEYALKGYDLQAVAYLLKPFSFKHFHLAVNKLISVLEIEKTFIWFKVGTMSQQIKVYINTIIAIEAMGNYIKIYTSTNEMPYIVHSSLTIAENKLRLKLKPVFIRLNKSLLIFENHIVK
ncbi:LytR/AlgR family response regulator transcription factor [Pedobacter fastidiosus]|uniref:LytTR family transcriptional regulator DNA-binding domain-containing protein n=1 Tax=Pedobacter fastidiosus TaxID=2765361 RepID=A0ABR7KXU6_9SPHI|nr:LytTR family transcriptional regulator DNA-binding domain-containing protein [Pedobacter fastidiosus]MBC6112950.1 LytTR family transcriptional regulator DNA-binding domain-containing protein [Pedobacter fastidiosus]